MTNIYITNKTWGIKKEYVVEIISVDGKINQDTNYTCTDRIATLELSPTQVVTYCIYDRDDPTGRRFFKSSFELPFYTLTIDERTARCICDNIWESRPNIVNRSDVYLGVEFLFEYKNPVDRMLETKNKKENKNMKAYEDVVLVKLVTSGPATIGWFGTPYKRDLMKVVVKRAEGEYDDPEKAILALYMKALSGGHTPFHSRMNKAMKMMYAAIDKEREIEEAKLAREEKIDHTFGENIVESFKETFNATEVSQEIATSINNSLNRLTSYVKRLKETNKKMELNSIYGVNNAKVEKKGEAWTWDEISFLNRHYNSKSTKSIAMALGRSEAAVRAKAKRLGIKKGGKTNG